MKLRKPREGGYGVATPQKFNPLGKESPLMKIKREFPDGNNTMTRFYNSRRSTGRIERTIPNIKSNMSENTTVNVRGKLKSLENEILEVTQVLNFHKKEVDLLRTEKETLQHVLNK